MSITEDQRKALNAAQKGELDAVIMYRMLAERTKSEEETAAMERLANDELRHAKVFRALTGDRVKASRMQGIFISVLYKTLGKKRVFPILAKGEYSAADKYEHLIAEFPEAAAVQTDEQKHGDALMGLL